MTYPTATDEDVAFFEEHGWIQVDDAIDPADLAELVEHCDEILRERDTMAFDWAWEEGTPREEREFRILQASPTRYFPELAGARFRQWATGFASALMRRDVEFWYDQFLAKSPQKGARTYWHQDEGYWGRNLDDRGITCWMPFHDVDVDNGCMHFVDGGHRDGILVHHQPDGVASDLLCCEPDETRAVARPLRLGAVTFHHSKTPHMTTPNVTDRWRRILSQHFREVGAPGEGGHYPWKVYVNQFTGRRIVPERS
ncbi:MAG: phytanoyl-CoA dioxygenase family protein [Actinomycetota bacterium]|nr:phytanoyl-CoA dioxygenase family protein [Actinomycetota bacterium]